MNNLLKCSLITIISIYVTGCSSLEQASEVEYIYPKKEVLVNLGESTIVHGAMENCGREARAWSEVSHLLPYSQTGFFSNAGRALMISDKCKGKPAPVLAVRFTANKLGTESFTVFDDPMTIVVTENANFLQSAIPNAKKPGAKPTASGSPSILKTLSEWIAR